jgi:hypothetical protein
VEHQVDHDYLAGLTSLDSLTDFKQSVTEYIGGFVVRQVNGLVKCDECRSSLVSEKSDTSMNLITTKDRGGLIKPSASVSKVCAVAEQCLQHVLRTKGVPRTPSNLVQALTSTVLKIVSENYQWCFQELNAHAMDCSLLHNHKHDIVKAIAICFIKIRLHHVAQLHTQKTEVFSYKLCLIDAVFCYWMQMPTFLNNYQHCLISQY